MDLNYYIVLGAGNQQIPLIRAVKNHGLQVIACDQKLNAPGLRQADMQIQCSIMKPREIVRLIHENIIRGEVVGVGCRSFGDAQRSAMLVAKKFEVPGHKPNKLKVFKNKKKLKAVLKKAGIAVIEEVFTPKDTWKKFVSYNQHVVARSINGYGKQDIHLLTTSQDYDVFYEKHHNHLEKYIYEPYINGSEITVLAMIQHKKCEVVCISDKQVLKEKPWFIEISHRYPSSISEYLRQQIPELMQKITDAIPLANGPLVAEFLIPHQKKKNMSPLYLLECQPEVGGEYLADQLLPKVCNFDYFGRLVKITSRAEAFATNSFETKNSNVPSTNYKNEQCFIIRYIPQRQDGILKNIHLPSKELSSENPYYAFHHVLKSPDDDIRIARGNLDRLLVFGMSSSLEESAQLSSHVEDIASRVVVDYY